MTITQFLATHPMLSALVNGLISEHIWGTLARLLALYRAYLIAAS